MRKCENISWVQLFRRICLCTVPIPNRTIPEPYSYHITIDSNLLRLWYNLVRSVYGIGTVRFGIRTVRFEIGEKIGESPLFEIFQVSIFFYLWNILKQLAVKWWTSLNLKVIWLNLTPRELSVTCRTLTRNSDIIQCIRSSKMV